MLCSRRFHRYRRRYGGDHGAVVFAGHAAPRLRRRNIATGEPSAPPARWDRSFRLRSSLWCLGDVMISERLSGSAARSSATSRPRPGVGRRPVCRGADSGPAARRALRRLSRNRGDHQTGADAGTRVVRIGQGHHLAGVACAVATAGADLRRARLDPRRARDADRSATTRRSAVAPARPQTPMVRTRFIRT